MIKYCRTKFISTIKRYKQTKAPREEEPIGIPEELIAYSQLPEQPDTGNGMEKLTPPTIPFSEKLPLLVSETKNIQRKLDSQILIGIRDHIDDIYLAYASRSTIGEEFRNALIHDAMVMKIMHDQHYYDIEDEFDLDLVIRRVMALSAIMTSVKVTDTLLQYNPHTLIGSVLPFLKTIYGITPRTTISGNLQLTMLNSIVVNSAYGTRPNDPLRSVLEVCYHLDLNDNYTAIILKNSLSILEEKKMMTH